MRPGVIDLAAHPAACDDAPARRLQRGVDQFGAGLGLVHSRPLEGLVRLRGQFAGEGFLQDGLFQLCEAVQLLLVDGFEALEFRLKWRQACVDNRLVRSRAGE